MSWAMVAGAAITVVGGAVNRRANDRANDAQQAGYDAATAENQRQFDINQQNMQPWLQAGQNALGLQEQFLAGDYGNAFDSPDYAARMDQGIKTMDRGAAAGGRLYSGGYDADRIRFGQQLATEGLNNYWNRLANVSGTGNQAAQGMGQFGQQFAENQGNLAIGAGNARASGYQAQADNTNQMLGGLAGWGMYGLQQRRPGGG